MSVKASIILFTIITPMMALLAHSLSGSSNVVAVTIFYIHYVYYTSAVRDGCVAGDRIHWMLRHTVIWVGRDYPQQVLLIGFWLCDMIQWYVIPISVMVSLCLFIYGYYITAPLIIEHALDHPDADKKPHWLIYRTVQLLPSLLFLVGFLVFKFVNVF